MIFIYQLLTVEIPDTIFLQGYLVLLHTIIVTSLLDNEVTIPGYCHYHNKATKIS